MNFRRIPLALLLLIIIACGARAADYALITVLHTNDLHGTVMVEGQPGLARIATLVREIRSEMPNVLLLDAGDMIHGGYENYLSGGQATISAMNAAGYTAATIGNHEHDFGLETLRKAVDFAAFPMLAANLKDRATGLSWRGVQPYVVATVQGVRIGILGLTTQDTINLQWPASIAEIQIDDPVETAKALVPELRRRADVVVVLSHIGHNLDRRLAEAVPDIDFIVGGHSHTAVDKWDWVGNTLIAQTGAYARQLGRIDFIAAVDESGARIVSVNGRDGRSWNNLERRPLDKDYPTSPLIPVPGTIPNDEAVAAAYQPYRDQASARLGRVIGEAVEAVPVFTSESGESPVGDFAADAIRAYAKSDIALIDSRSVVSGLAPGPITIRDAFGAIDGFTRQQIVTVRMKGSEILSVLESQLVKNGALHFQVSGIAFSYNQQRNGWAVVRNAAISGLPVQPEREYVIASQAYVIQDIMKMIPSEPVTADLTLSAREAIVEYVRSIKRVPPPVGERIKLEQETVENAK
ncbi:MAG: bifunctional metallophosphatase/5'-nucleotidase [Armatimonadetes bacterium]|nr:bifunctional metallophosphatase/5'-nucleotidase [Armatimonadota bacterium]